MSTADQDFDHLEVAHGTSTFQVPFSRRKSPYGGRQNGHLATERERKEGFGEEPVVGRVSEGRCKFDGTDYPSWLEFDPLKKPDEPYTFPFPVVDGDPWEKVSRMVKRHDDHMCDAWVEEIQNILIFAGLFSAVVTAFAVETQKLLQPDPSMTSVVLLAQIASHLMPNASTIVNPALTSQPPSVSVQTLRINTFIFISLILALGTALIGILALQWIRSYKNQDLRSHQDQLSIRQGRHQAFMDWGVPQIITALPIVLQTALVLFFIGLVDFLKSQHSQLATIIGVVVGIILAVVVFTTVAPALYVCFLHQEYSHGKPAPIPPYWSPQSWLCYQISMYMNALWFLVRGKSWFRGSMVASWDDFLLRSVPNHSEGSFDHWLSPALGWVFQNLTTEESFNSAYHCFQSLSKREVAEEVVVDYLWSDHRLLPRLLQDFKTLESSSYSSALSLYVLQFRFRHRTPSLNMYLHSMELGLRAMACNPARYDDHGNRLPIYFPASFLLKSEPKLVPGQSSSQEQNIWLYAFLLTLQLRCAHFSQGDNSLSRQFAVFWGIAINAYGTRVGEDGMWCLKDWIKSVPQGKCDIDKARLEACIFNIVTYLPLKSKALASAAKFCQSDAFLQLLDCFVDDAEVHEVWLQTLANWPASPSTLDFWDQFLISLRPDKKYWALGFTQENLQHLEHELMSRGKLSMKLPRSRAISNAPPAPRAPSLLSSGHQRLVTMFGSSPRASKVSLSPPAIHYSVSAPQHPELGLDIRNTAEPESTTENLVPTRTSIYSITTSHTPDDQQLQVRLPTPEEIQSEIRTDSAPGSITIVVDRNPIDIIPPSSASSPIQRRSLQLPDPESPSAALSSLPPWPPTPSIIHDISPPSSPGPYEHFIDPMTWAMEVPATTGVEENQDPLLVPGHEAYNGNSSTIPIDRGETREDLDSKGR